VSFSNTEFYMCVSNRSFVVSIIWKAKYVVYHPVNSSASVNSQQPASDSLPSAECCHSILIKATYLDYKKC
jgi:hypothetical protein